MTLDDTLHDSAARGDVAQDRIDRLARRRAGAKMGWFIHATVYVLVNAVLIALSLGSGRHWAVFPLLGWGLGLAMHGVSVWVLAPGNQVFENMVQRERARLSGRKADKW